MLLVLDFCCSLYLVFMCDGVLVVVLRLSEGVKLTFAFFVPVVLFLVVLLFYSFSGVSVFYGGRGEALDLLGIVVQCLSVVVAIVFLCCWLLLKLRWVSIRLGLLIMCF